MFLRFTDFQQRHYDSVLVDVRDPGMSIGQVEEPAQAAQAQGTQVLELKHRKAVRAESSGAATFLQRILNVFRCEWLRAVV